MSKPTPFFVQACPICGRPLQVPANLLGCGVTCQHCRGTFVANRETAADDSTNDGRAAMRRRIETLLVAAGHRGEVSRRKRSMETAALFRPFIDLR
jgi:hypothetical protein